MADAGEPSVEEILASIKKVIARDNRASDRQRPAAEPREPLPPIELHNDQILELSDVEFAEDEADEDEAPLVAETAVSSMRESLEALSVMAQPGVAPQIVRSGETSLEGLTRELLRPALAEWLDKHLPPLVETMVAAEIARIVGKKA